MPLNDPEEFAWITDDAQPQPSAHGAPRPDSPTLGNDPLIRSGKISEANDYRSVIVKPAKSPSTNQHPAPEPPGQRAEPDASFTNPRPAPPPPSRWSTDTTDFARAAKSKVPGGQEKSQLAKTVNRALQVFRKPSGPHR